MNNCTMNTYEVKRDLLNFSKKISNGVNHPTEKFIMDMQFGLAKSGSCLISEIARSLNENIKLSYTIERLCDNLFNMYEDESQIIWKNYLNEVENGTIKVIITKNLSRLGRNNYECSYYMDCYFPDVGIRFMTVQEDVDTLDLYKSSNDYAYLNRVVKPVLYLNKNTFIVSGDGSSSSPYILALLDEKKVTLKLNDKKLEIDKIFENENLNEIAWRIDDSKIAKIENNKIIPLKVGETTISGLIDADTVEGDG